MWVIVGENNNAREGGGGKASMLLLMPCAKFAINQSLLFFQRTCMKESSAP